MKLTPSYINKSLKYKGEKQKDQYKRLQTLPSYEKNPRGWLKRIVSVFYVLFDSETFAVRFDKSIDFED